jgi:glutathione transport system substrate-binding protein
VAFEISRRQALAGTAGLAAASIAGLPRARAAGKDLVVGVPDNLTGLDPSDVNDTLSQSACRLFFQNLFGFDKDMKIEPQLALSYTANDAATEFTIKLREGVKFHDGTDFDSAAVKFNLERLANPANHLKRGSLMSMLDTVETPDKHTAVLKLKTPFGAMINTLAHPGTMMLSPAAVQKYGKDISRNPVGTGPFTFVSWSADTLKAKKHDGYWKPGLPKVDTVTFRSVPENGARIAMLQTGEAQFIYPLPPEMMKIVEHNKKIAIINAPSIIARYVAMNCMKKPFDNPKVRQAMNYAVNKEAYIKVVWNGFADPMDSPLPPHLAFYKKQGNWPYDPAKAKQLLAEAGLPNGFEIEMIGSNNTLVQRGMEFLQQQLAQVGVKVKVTPLEAGVLASRIWSVQKPEDATVRMYYGGWSSSTGDADWGIRPLLDSASFPPKLFNVAYYKNIEVDAAIQAGLDTADPAKRAEAYAKAQELVWHDAPWIFLSVDHLLAGHAANLKGMYQIPDGGLLTEEAEFV